VTQAQDRDHARPPRRRRLRRFIVVVVALLGAGLGTAAGAHYTIRTKNFVDPAGPRFAGCCATEPGRSELRVVTFNIQYSVEIDGAIRLFKSTPELRDADFVLLQEMDEDGVRRIADALSLRNYVYYPAAISRGNGRDFGNAILSRWPLEDDRKVILPHPGFFDNMQRIAVRATARVGGQRIRLYSVHLATMVEQLPGARADQALAVVADAEQSLDPVIVAGDTNAPGMWKVFDAHGFACVSRDLGGTRGMFSIDHVFARGLHLRPGPSRGVVRNHDDVSDHSPVWTVLSNQT